MTDRTETGTLKEYRDEVRKLWLSIVNRRKLKSYEYTLIEKWHLLGVPLSVVLQAIRDCTARALSASKPLYSIGIIQADIERLKGQQARAQVGAQRTADWREKWIGDVEAMIEEAAEDPERVAYSEFLAELPRLSIGEAQMRWRELQSRLSREK